MDQLRGLGWLPDIPSHLDYTEDHPRVAALLKRTKLAPKIAASAAGERASAPAASPAQVDLARVVLANRGSGTTRLLHRPGGGRVARIL